MIHLVVASDRNLIRQAGITALSAVQHSSQQVSVAFLTPARDVRDPEWPAVISVLESRGATCSLVPVAFEESLQLAEHLNLITYYRLLIPELLPATIDRVIYLDCDVLVQRDLAELWQTDLNGCAIAAVPDPAFSDWRRLGLDLAAGYFNAGVLLIDVAALRARGAFRDVLQFAKEHPERLTWADQCALNVIFQRQWFKLDSRWNYQYRAFVGDVLQLGKREALQRAGRSVFHFNNYDRPWQAESAHPLKHRYMTISRSHPALQIRQPMTVRALWKRMKRTVKWQVPRLLQAR